MNALAHTKRPWYQAIGLALLSPFLEKNPAKALAIDAPFVFSKTSILLALFAAAMLRQIWKAGIAGWPDAIFCVFLVIGIPLCEALTRVSPDKVLELGKVLLGRFGVGGTRQIGSVFDPREPSIHDDHTVD